MKPAIPSTTIQTGFHLLLLQALVVTFAINAEATSNFTLGQTRLSVEKNGCSDLLGAGSQNSTVSPGAHRFLAHVDIALRVFMSERTDLLIALRKATETAHPMNPFLDLSTYQAKALSQAAESILGELTQDEWLWLQTKIQALLASTYLEKEQKIQSVQQTSRVGSFQYVSNLKLNQTLGQAGWVDYGHGSRIYLGAVGELHLFIIRAHSESDTFSGLVGISELHDQDAPFLKGILGYNTLQSHAGKKNSEIANVDMQKIWVLDGKLYVVLKNHKNGSEILAQLDPVTGLMVQKFQVPENGRVQIWILGNGQIVAANFAGGFLFFGRAEAKRFYKFDSKVGAFVRTGLDVSSLHSRNPFFVRGRHSAKLVLDEHGHFTSDGISLQIDHADKYHLQEINHRFGLFNTFEWSPAHKAGVKIYDSDDGHRFLSLLIFGDTRVVGGRNRAVEDSKGSPVDRTFEIEISNNIENLDRLSVDVSELPGTAMNVVYISALLSHPSAWVIDRETLEVKALKVPEDLSPPNGQWSVTWRLGLDIARTINNRGEYVLSLANRNKGTFKTWVLDPETLVFDNPQVTGLPIPYDTGQMILAPDGKSVVAQYTKEGIWLRGKLRLHRPEVPE